MLSIYRATLKERALIKRVEKAVLKHLGQANIFSTEISVVGEEEIHALNKVARGVDRVTDVLSFPTFDKLALPVTDDDFCDFDYDKKGVMLGSIVICRQRAKDQAAEYGHGYDREFGFLVCHGFLHLLGFDHVVEDDEKVMFAHQNAIMGIANLKR